MLDVLTPPDDVIWRKAYALAQKDGKAALLESIPKKERNYLLKLLRQVSSDVTEGKPAPRDIHQISPAFVRIDYIATQSGQRERDVEIFQIAGPLNRLGAFEPDQFFAFDEERRRKQFKIDRVRRAYLKKTGEIIDDLGRYLLARQIKR